MPKPHTKAEWDSAIERIALVIPLARDVTISYKRHRIPDSVGYTILDDTTGRFTVGVDIRTDVYAMQETLIHEAAHVLDWRPYTAWSMDHGPTWGVLYAQIYRQYHGLQ